MQKTKIFSLFWVKKYRNCQCLEGPISLTSHSRKMLLLPLESTKTRLQIIKTHIYPGGVCRVSTQCRVFFYVCTALNIIIRGHADCRHIIWHTGRVGTQCQFFFFYVQHLISLLEGMQTLDMANRQSQHLVPGFFSMYST